MSSSSDEESISSRFMRRILFTTAGVFPIMHHITRKRARERRHGGSRPGRRFIRRPRVEYHRQIFSDYFANPPRFSDAYFRQRFRMKRELFIRIQDAIVGYDPYFVQRSDCTGAMGFSPLQKITAALRMLAYGCPADELEKYLGIAESTAIESLRHFCDAILHLFRGEYLRRPNQEDIDRMLAMGEARGWPGMLGSLDCMHWNWKKCPNAWHDAHPGVHHGSATVIMECVASYDLWIWHAYFGIVGSKNDLKVLDRSDLFDDVIYRKKNLVVQYKVNGHQYNQGYFLVDEIYPKRPTFVSAISNPISEKQNWFAQKQESTRKDVERAFGVLQSRFGIMAQPVRNWHREDLERIMKTCIILHNMIVENERDENIENWEPPIDESREDVNAERGGQLAFETIISRHALPNEQENVQLKHDLVEHHWNKHDEAA